MAKTCIICNNPAGSAEHVFPAALGGRRINKGIYRRAGLDAPGHRLEPDLEDLLWDQVDLFQRHFANL